MIIKRSYTICMIGLLFLLLLSHYKISVCFAETFNLRNGETIKGKISEETNEGYKITNGSRIDKEGRLLSFKTYFLKKEDVRKRIALQFSDIKIPYLEILFICLIFIGYIVLRKIFVKKIPWEILHFSIFIILVGLWNFGRFIGIGLWGGFIIVTTRNYLTPHHEVLMTSLFRSCAWLIGGWGLLQLKFWARKFLIVIACLSLFFSIVSLLVFPMPPRNITLLFHVGMLLFVVIFLSQSRIKKQFKTNNKNI